LNDIYSQRAFFKHKYIHIPKGQWHQIENPSDSENLVIIEVQYGEKCEETDIERREENIIDDLFISR
jgi:mannose-6-phosphate isomerase-like protein (cupin superfamily)